MVTPERGLELPQVPLQRYLELLKRRRWQVIPVSILGLVVGGLVAIAIPRYYVANAVVSYTRGHGEKGGTAEDPMADLVEVAKLTIPVTVGETLQTLSWGEYAGLDPFAAQQFERGVERRLEVIDRNPGRTRSYAQLLLAYRDRDGPRSAEFLNRLVEIWMNRQLERIRQDAADALATANVQAEAAVRAFETASEDIRNLELEHGLRHDLTPQEESALRQEDEKQRAARRKEQHELSERRDSLVAELKQLRVELERTPRTLELGVPPAPATPTPLEVQARARLLWLEQALAFSLGPQHPSRPLRELELKVLTDNLRKMHNLDQGKRDVPNPVHLGLRTRIAAGEVELKGVEARLLVVEEAIQKDDQRKQSLAQAMHQYRSLQARLKEATESRQSKLREVDRLTEVLARLTNERPIAVVQKALVPPKPTEPNVVIIALVGCGLGLGAAIALILALDVLQGTYKTVEEVERGLPVPVLGGMAHMESEQKRQQVRRGRRRTSLAVAIALVLVLAVVTLYYVDPTQLPPAARDLLSLVLGE